MNKETGRILIPVTFQRSTVTQNWLKTYDLHCSHHSQTDTHTKHTQNVLVAVISLMKRQLQHSHVYAVKSLLFALFLHPIFNQTRPQREIHSYRLYISCLIWLNRLGQTNRLTLGIKDGIVLPDEDISQDPELLRATLAKAGHATIGALRRDKRKQSYFPQTSVIVLKAFLFQWLSGIQQTWET